MPCCSTPVFWFLASGKTKTRKPVLSHGEGRKIYRLSDILTSVAEAEQLSWEVFPNPAQSRLTVRWGELSARGPASLKVYNSLSQPMLFPLILLSPGSKEATLDISGWPKGLYVICLESGEKRLWKRVLIQ